MMFSVGINPIKLAFRNNTVTVNLPVSVNNNVKYHWLMPLMLSDINLLSTNWAWWPYWGILVSSLSQTEHSKFRTKMTEGQFSPVDPDRRTGEG